MTYFEHIYKHDGVDICSEKFYIVDKPHKKYRQGFPLDSLAVDIKTMKYYYDIEESKANNSDIIDGIRNFFIRSINDY